MTLRVRYIIDKNLTLFHYISLSLFFSFSWSGISFIGCQKDHPSLSLSLSPSLSSQELKTDINYILKSRSMMKKEEKKYHPM